MKKFHEASVSIGDVIAATDNNILTATRLLSRIVTEICDDQLRPFRISSVQFSILEVIGCNEPATRASIARAQHLDKSTLTRNLKSILSEGWAEELRGGGDGRSRPLALTKAGKNLLAEAHPAWLVAQARVRALLGLHGVTAVLSGTDRSANLSADPTQRSDEGIPPSHDEAPTKAAG